MTAIIAGLAALLVMGAFLWLKPSPRDQYLSKLRSEALVQGFRIGSLRIPDTSEYGRVHTSYIIVTLYQLTTVIHESSESNFSVTRTTGESGAYLPDGWQWISRNKVTDQQYGQLRDFLTKLPVSVQLVTSDQQSVGLSWDEKDANVSFDQIKTWLQAVAKFSDKKLISTG